MASKDPPKPTKRVRYADSPTRDNLLPGTNPIPNYLPPAPAQPDETLMELEDLLNDIDSLQKDLIAQSSSLSPKPKRGALETAAAAVSAGSPLPDVVLTPGQTRRPFGIPIGPNSSRGPHQISLPGSPPSASPLQSPRSVTGSTDHIYAQPRYLSDEHLQISHNYSKQTAIAQPGLSDYELPMPAPYQRLPADRIYSPESPTSPRDMASVSEAKLVSPKKPPRQRTSSQSSSCVSSPVEGRKNRLLSNTSDIEDDVDSALEASQSKQSEGFNSDTDVISSCDEAGEGTSAFIHNDYNTLQMNRQLHVETEEHQSHPTAELLPPPQFLTPDRETKAESVSSSGYSSSSSRQPDAGNSDPAGNFNPYDVPSPSYTKPAPGHVATSGPPAPVQTTKKASDDQRDRKEPRDEKVHNGPQGRDEMISAAMEKLKQASVQRLIVKTYTDDGCCKTIAIDEDMRCREIVYTLMDKNHLRPGPNWVLAEHMPDLGLERFLEDHEALLPVIKLWTRNSNNVIRFVERTRKYDLFFNPQRYLLEASVSPEELSRAQYSKEALIEDHFVNNLTVPNLEGVLYLRSSDKKWKKHYFVLRASGLYMYKGKSKASKDLTCVTGFDNIHPHYCVNPREKLKAPSDFVFALKHPTIQAKSKDIKYLCGPDPITVQRWVTAIRIIKHGKQLWLNFEQTTRELDQLSRLHTDASFSCSSLLSYLHHTPSRRASIQSGVSVGSSECDHSGSAASPVPNGHGMVNSGSSTLSRPKTLGQAASSHSTPFAQKRDSPLAVYQNEEMVPSKVSSSSSSDLANKLFRPDLPMPAHLLPSNPQGNPPSPNRSHSKSLQNVSQESSPLSPALIGGISPLLLQPRNLMFTEAPPNPTVPVIHASGTLSRKSTISPHSPSGHFVSSTLRRSRTPGAVPHSQQHSFFNSGTQTLTRKRSESFQRPPIQRTSDDFNERPFMMTPFMRQPQQRPELTMDTFKNPGSESQRSSQVSFEGKFPVEHCSSSERSSEGASANQSPDSRIYDPVYQAAYYDVPPNDGSPCSPSNPPRDQIGTQRVPHSGESAASPQDQNRVMSPVRSENGTFKSSLRNSSEARAPPALPQKPVVMRSFSQGPHRKPANLPLKPQVPRRTISSLSPNS